MRAHKGNAYFSTMAKQRTSFCTRRGSPMTRMLACSVMSTRRAPGTSCAADAIAGARASWATSHGTKVGYAQLATVMAKATGAMSRSFSGFRVGEGWSKNVMGFRFTRAAAFSDLLATLSEKVGKVLAFAFWRAPISELSLRNRRGHRSDGPTEAPEPAELEKA